MNKIQKFLLFIIICLIIILLVMMPNTWQDVLPSTPESDQSEVFEIQKAYGDAVVSKIVSVYDGDTFTVNVDDWPEIVGNKIGVRILGIDTPEMNDVRTDIKTLANAAKLYSEKKLTSATQVKLLNIQRDKYFRILADVEVDGDDLGKLLIKANLAKAYDGGTKPVWSMADYKRYKK